MPAATLAPTASERPTETGSLDLLERAQGAEFDSLVRAASLACGAPIATISLLDANRLQLAAHVGLGGTAEMPSDAALCARTMLGDGLLEIPDTALDPRCARKPPAGRPAIRFYAGVPLRLSDGQAIGTLCVLDWRPRDLDDTQRTLLRCLASAAEGAAEHARAAQTLSASADGFRHLYQATPAMLHSLDVDGRLLTVTDGWLAKLGYHRAEVIGRLCTDFLTPDSREHARSAQVSILATGKCDTVACQMICRDGSLLDVEISAVLERLGDGRPWRVVAAIEDATPRRRAERALVAEGQRLSNLIEADGVGTWEWNVRTGAMRFNDRWARMIGATLDELGPLSIRTWLDSVHADDVAMSLDLLTRHLEGRSDRFEMEARMRHRDGHFVWVLDRGTVMTRSPDGDPEWMFGTRTDISARKRQEEIRRKNEEFLDRAGRIAGVGGWELDLATKELFWTAETYRIHGVAPDYRPNLDDAIGFYAPEARPIILAAVEKCAADGTVYDLELAFNAADGRRLWVRAVGSATFADGRAVRLTGAFQDITARVAERQALRDALDRLRLATDGGGIGIWDYDVAGNRVHWDARMYQLYGMNANDERETVKTWANRVHADDRANAEKSVRDALDGVRPYECEFRIILDDGSVRHLRGAGQVTRDATGRAVRMLGTSTDVTEARLLASELILQAERQAEAAEREMALFRNSPDVLYIVGVHDIAGEIAFVFETLSPALTQATGWKPEDLVGRRPEECLPAGVAADAVASYRRCVQEGKTIFSAGAIETPAGRRDFEGSVSPIRGAATGRVVRLAGSLRDVTDRNRMQATLSQNHKMHAIGRLAAGVAHDFNNILQSISGGLELVQDEIAPGTPAANFLAIGLRAARRGSDLTHHLLSYARKQILRPRTINLHTLLSDVEALLVRTLSPQIAIATRIEERALLVSADPGQIQTALLNLAINASHAMLKGGSLLLEAREIDEDGARWIAIAVTDTGTGMDAATIAQATEPFFTTKGPKGTGLGLSMVHGFAEQSGGRLGIRSELGHGTTVELLLPAAAPDDRSVSPTSPPSLSERAHVLLVDDDADVLVTTGAFLDKEGFSIVRAANGNDALALLASGQQIDAIVTDYAMPGLNGVDLIAEARIARPELPAILISGFVDVMAPDALGDRIVTLHKPFQRQTLIDALRGALTKHRRGASVPCAPPED